MGYINGGTAVDAAILMGKVLGVGIAMFLPVGWAIEGGQPFFVFVVWLIGIWWVFYILLNHVERRIEEQNREATELETDDSVIETPEQHG